MTALLIVAGWAFAEAIVLFIVADVPISAVALRYGWRGGWRAALLAAVFAALGGLVTIAWARTDPDASLITILSLPGIDADHYESAAADWRANGFAAMLAGSFSGVPYKLYAHAAGVQGTGAAGFLLASIAARLPRFALIAAVFAGLGRALLPRLPGRSIAALFLMGWTVFYSWYFHALGGF